MIRKILVKKVEGDLVFMKDSITILKTQTFEPILVMPLDHIFKWKEDPGKGVNFFAVFEDGPVSKASKGNTWFVAYEESADLIQFYYSLIDYLQKTKKNEKELERERYLKSKAALQGAKAVTVDPNALSLTESYVGSVIPAPRDQNFVLVDFDAAELKRSPDISQKKSIPYVKDDDSHLVFYQPEIFPQDIVDLFKSVLAGLDDLASVVTYISNVSLGSRKVNAIPLDILKGQCFNYEEEVGLIAEALGFLSYYLFPPAQAFAPIHTIRELLADFTKDKWQNKDYLIQLDADLLSYATSLALGQDNLNTCLAYVVHGLLTGKNDDSGSNYNLLVDLNQLLLLEAICSGRVLASCGANALVAPLHTVPQIPVFEPFLLTNLGELINAEILPLNANLDINDYNAFLRDLNHITSFLKSPLSLYLQSKTPKIMDGMADFPNTLVDAFDFYRLARENAFVLWNTNQFKNGFRVKALADLAATALNAFDMNPIDMYEKILAMIRENKDFLDLITNVQGCLNLYDPTFCIIDALLDTGHDFNSGVKLLAIDSDSLKGRVGIVQLSIANLLSGLSNLTKLSLGRTGNVVQQNFNAMSYAYMSVAKGVVDVNSLFDKFIDLGDTLQLALNDLNPMDKRLRAADKVRSILNLMGLIVTDVPLAVKKFLEGPVKSGALSRQMLFNFDPVDISPSIKVLNSISSVLSGLAELSLGDIVTPAK